MTNKEAIISLCGFEPNKNALERVLVDYGIDGQGVYSNNLTIPAKKAARSLIQTLLSTADTKNENGFWIEYDRDAILKRLALLDEELEGESTGIPTVTSRRVW